MDVSLRALVIEPVPGLDHRGFRIPAGRPADEAPDVVVPPVLDGPEAPWSASAA